MAALSEALQFPHHDCSRGSTVEKPFLVDLANALGLENAADMTKYEILHDAHRLLFGGAPMPAEYLSTGSTVTDNALERLLEGVLRGGYAAIPLDRGAAALRLRVDINIGDLAVELPDPFAQGDLLDERRFALQNVVRRPGQGRFRDAVLDAYRGQCAITGCRENEVLEAAHIRPFKGANSDVVPNGIALRIDLHRLWDTGLLALGEETFEVLIAPTVGDETYRSLAGKRANLPQGSRAPSPAALRLQREWCGL
ncbi:HNH endonuclease [Agromyces tardus]|uniref:HNH endonuclease n=2 Tax=Agromyces tardus TaxID=2583849 RepID=A0A3M8AK69_9MICO|nr:HNH endonuclease [Agromyces tardus]